MQVFRLRVGDGTAHTAAHHGHLFVSVQLGRHPQRPRHVGDKVPLLQGPQQQRARAHFLEHDLDRCLLYTSVRALSMRSRPQVRQAQSVFSPWRVRMDSFPSPSDQRRTCGRRAEDIHTACGPSSAQR